MSKISPSNKAVKQSEVTTKKIDGTDPKKIDGTDPKKIDGTDPLQKKIDAILELRGVEYHKARHSFLLEVKAKDAKLLKRVLSALPK